MKYVVSMLLATIICNPAWAINKCTGSDGKVVYQDAVCDTKNKAIEKIKTWESDDLSSKEPSGRWKFERKKDAMTGEVACMAISPITYPKVTESHKFIPVHAVFLANGRVEIIGIRTSTDKDLFHIDLSSTGMKTDNGAFTPFTLKSGSHVVGLENGAEMIKNLEASKHLKVRARFWPHDQLYEMEPIPSTGFITAVSQARYCAKQQ